MRVFAVRVLQTIAFFLLTSFLFFVEAQEKTNDVNINIQKNNGHTWYTSPWVWIIGSIVFILLLIALLKGSEKKKLN